MHFLSTSLSWEVLLSKIHFGGTESSIIPCSNIYIKFWVFHCRRDGQPINLSISPPSPMNWCLKACWVICFFCHPCFCGISVSWGTLRENQDKKSHDVPAWMDVQALGSWRSKTSDFKGFTVLFSIRILVSRREKCLFLNREIWCFRNNYICLCTYVHTVYAVKSTGFKRTMLWPSESSLLPWQHLGWLSYKLGVCTRKPILFQGGRQSRRPYLLAVQNDSHPIDWFAFSPMPTGVKLEGNVHPVTVQPRSKLTGVNYSMYWEGVPAPAVVGQRVQRQGLVGIISLTLLRMDRILELRKQRRACRMWEYQMAHWIAIRIPSVASKVCMRPKPKNSLLKGLFLVMDVSHWESCSVLLAIQMVPIGR